MTYFAGMLGTHSACGKLILLGEHFVVHGAPALVIPLTSLRTVVGIYEESNGGGLRLEADVSTADAALARKLIAAAFERLRIDEPSGWLIRAESQIPVGHGLGSSAAFAVALIGALARATGREPRLPALNEHAHALERLVHGTPSGIDDTVATYQRPLRFRRGEPMRELGWPEGLRVVLASSGRAGSTREAVAGVADLKERHPAGFAALCAEAVRVVEAGIQAFEAGAFQSLGGLLDQNHALLQQIGVSTEALDRLVVAAREAGALGAKLTGGGLGGMVVALVQEDTEAVVVHALARAGAPMVLRSGAG